MSSDVSADSYQLADPSKDDKTSVEQGLKSREKLPLGTRWKLKWLSERSQRSRAARQDKQYAGTSSRDPLTTDQNWHVSDHASTTNAVAAPGLTAASNVAELQNPLEMTPHLGEASRARHDIFSNRRTRTRRWSGRLWGQQASQASVSGGRPELKRRYFSFRSTEKRPEKGAQGTRGTFSFILRMIGVVGLRAACPEGSWPLLRLLCMSGLPQLKQPIVLIGKKLLPALPSFFQAFSVPLKVGVETFRALQSLSGPLIVVSAISVANSYCEKPGQRSKKAQMGDIQPNLCIGQFGECYMQSAYSAEVSGSGTEVHVLGLADCQGMYSMGGEAVVVIEQQLLPGQKGEPAAGMAGSSCQQHSMARGMSALSLLDGEGGQSVLDITGLSSEASSSDGDERGVRLQDIGWLSHTSSSSSLGAPEGAPSVTYVKAKEGSYRESGPCVNHSSLHEPISLQDQDPHALGTEAGCCFASASPSLRCSIARSCSDMSEEEWHSCASSQADEASLPSTPCASTPPSHLTSPHESLSPPPAAYQADIYERRMRRHSHGDQRYASLEELQAEPWSQLVFWHGRDKCGRGTLCVRLGLAVKTLSRQQLDRIAVMIISHVEYAELNFLPREGARAHEINLVVDVEGLGLMRMPPMEKLQRVGYLLNRDYPGRGGYIYVTNPPVVLGTVLSVLSRTFAPKNTPGSVRQRGFVARPDNVIVVNRRHRASFLEHYDDKMLCVEQAGSCRCTSPPQPCPPRSEFLQYLSQCSVHPPFAQSRSVAVEVGGKNKDRSGLKPPLPTQPSKSKAQTAQGHL